MEKRKFDFSIVNSLGAWTNANGQELLEQEILKSETVAAIGVYPGVKYKAELKYLATDALLQAAACGTPTTSGSTTLSHKDVEVKPYMVYESLCPADLDSTALSLSMTPGWNESLPFEGQYVSSKVKQIKKKIEDKLWTNKSGATEFGGFLEQFDADSDVVDVVFDFTLTATTETQLIAGYRKIIAEIPEELVGMEDLTLFMGHDAFRRLSTAFLNSNNILLQKFDFNGINVFEFPGAEYVKIVPLNGLNASNNTDKRVVITPASNLLYVCDMQSEEESINMWYSVDTRLVKFQADFKIGAAYKFGAYVVVSQKA